MPFAEGYMLIICNCLKFVWKSLISGQISANYEPGSNAEVGVNQCDCWHSVKLTCLRFPASTMTLCQLVLWYYIFRASVQGLLHSVKLTCLGFPASTTTMPPLVLWCYIYRSSVQGLLHSVKLTCLGFPASTTTLCQLVLWYYNFRPSVQGLLATEM